MTLKEIIETLNDIALTQPAIGGLVESGDVFDLNTDMQARYATFAVVQQQHTEDAEGIHYNFYLYYIDRMTNDKSNRLQIQSTGMQVLSNILRTFEQEYDDEITIGTKIYQPFTQQFNDICAGVYCNATIICDPEDGCAEIY